VRGGIFKLEQMAGKLNPVEVRLCRKRLFKIGLGILILYIGLNRLNILLGTQKTEGEVIAYQINSSPAFLPEIRYYSPEGQSVRFVGGEGSFFDIGEKVPVIFKINNPSEAWIYTFLSFWYPALIWAIFPLILLIAAVFSFVRKDEVIVMNLFKKFRIRKIRISPDFSNEENLRINKA
jgi:hypothetical protein